MMRRLGKGLLAKGVMVMDSVTPQRSDQGERRCWEGRRCLKDGCEAGKVECNEEMLDRRRIMLGRNEKWLNDKGKE